MAEFLRDSLREVFQTQELVAEDRGWMLPIANDQFPLWIGCGNYEEYADGYSSASSNRIHRLSEGC